MQIRRLFQFTISVLTVLILSPTHFTNAVKDKTLEDEEKRYPHIILVIADDLGFNDVSFHGSPQIPTPNLDALAYSGLILNNYYVSPICTPSRSSLFTGKHPIHTGMQHNVIYGTTPYGLPLSVKLLPEYLRDMANYSTHLVGKWHLGHFRRCYTPLCRGFDSHFGHWTGHKDYYDNTAQETGPQAWGYDTRRGFDVSYDHFGKYTTDVYTEEAQLIIQSHAQQYTDKVKKEEGEEGGRRKNGKFRDSMEADKIPNPSGFYLPPSPPPARKDVKKPLFLVLSHTAVHSANPYKLLQAPEDAVEKFEWIKDPARRTYAAMVSKLDDSVGSVVRTLEENAMLNDSIIIFTTDNGGPAAGFNGNAASNWPLRGVKNTLFEGGVRGAGFIWSPLLKSTPQVFTKLMHIQDWLPTIISGALDLDLDPFKKDHSSSNTTEHYLDGVNMWEAMNRESVPSPRAHLLHNIDDSYGNEGVRSGDWKLLKGTTYNGKWDSWYGPSGFEPNASANSNTKNTNTSQALVNLFSFEDDEDKSRKQQWNLMLDSEAGKAILNLKKWDDSIADKTMLNLNESTFNAMKNEAKVVCRKPMNTTKDNECNLKSGQYCLFNVKEDPCEYVNLAKEHPEMLNQLIDLMQKYRESAVRPGNKPKDSRGLPMLWNYTWTNWLDFLEPEPPQPQIKFDRNLNRSFTESSQSSVNVNPCSCSPHKS